jgi:transposase-like protein
MINIEFNSLFELHKAFPDEQTCIDHLEQMRWGETGVISPFDSSSKVYSCEGNKYKCKSTGKYFNVKTGTLFDNTKIELQKWFYAIWIFTNHKKGISSLQLSRDITITQKSAWFMLARIRACFGIEELKPEMEDNTQFDETFVGGKNKNRHKDKKVAQSQGRSFKDKTPVLGMMSNGMVRTQVVESTSARHIQPHVFKHVPQGTTIITDEWLGYNGLEEYYDRQVVDHTRKQYINDLGHSTNQLEGFWSHLKRGIIGIYHNTSRRHLQGYADEFAFRYNSRLFTDSKRFNLLLAHNYCRTKYKDLVS